MIVDNLVFVDSSKTMNGVLRFQSASPKFEPLRPMIDQFDSLYSRSSISSLASEVDVLDLELKFSSTEVEDEYQRLLASAYPFFETSNEWVKNHSLWKFQAQALNYIWSCFEQNEKRALLELDAGMGKTLCSILLAQKLFEYNYIDICLVFCKKIKTVDWQEEFMDKGSIPSWIVVGPDRQKRIASYTAPLASTIIMNYEKVRYPTTTGRGKKKTLNWGRTDLQPILEMVNGKRVLIVIDEIQKLGNEQSLISQGFNHLIESCDPYVLGLTATPYRTSPFNIRNIFRAINPSLHNVADLSEENFKREYALEWERNMPWFGEYGRVKSWNPQALNLLGKRFERLSCRSSKSDPEISSQFPKMIEDTIYLDLSDEDREVYDFALSYIRDKYEEDRDPSVMLSSVQTLRSMCNTMECLKTNSGALSGACRARFPLLPSTAQSNKYKLVENIVENIAEEEERVVFFSFWTNNTLIPYHKELSRTFKDIPIFLIHGQLSPEEMQQQIKNFNNARYGVLLSSDVAQEGVNLYAPYLYNIEICTTVSGDKQRKDRIHRGDSISKGIDTTWINRLVTRSSIEEAMQAKLFQRREESASIQGISFNKEDITSYLGSSGFSTESN